jgi:lipoprotein-anchoring transpeptidase ErfK/SrfK
MVTRARPLRAAAAATALLAVAAASGCGGARTVATQRAVAPALPPTPSPIATSTPAAPPPAVIATARQRLTVFRSPDAGGPYEHLSRRTDFGSPRVLLVTAQTDGWVQALLPQRPNGSRGWVPASQVQLSTTPLRVEVSVRTHRVVVLRGDTRVLAAKVVTGMSGTPTPRGTFYVTDKVRVPPDQPWYGPYALALSGFSPTLATFNGGDAIVALHGTNEPQLLGTSASHGCIRMPNAAILRLAHLLPLGTPVTIH